MMVEKAISNIFFPTAQIQDDNVMIDRRNFFDQPTKMI